jgi:hypothetical protein
MLQNLIRDLRKGGLHPIDKSFIIVSFGRINQIQEKFLFELMKAN